MTAAEAVIPWLLILTHALSMPATPRTANRQAEGYQFEYGQDVSRDNRALGTYGEPDG